MIRLFAVLFFLLANTFFNISYADNTGELIIEVTGLRNVSGSVRIGIYDSEENWLKKGVYEIRVTADKTVTFNIPNLKYGEYSYLIFHDENDDTQYNVDFFPVPKPKEGVWVSNGALPSMSPPNFKNANFSFRNSYRLEKVVLKYY